jgi:hypothetical protein
MSFFILNKEHSICDAKAGMFPAAAGNQLVTMVFYGIWRGIRKAAQ